MVIDYYGKFVTISREDITTIKHAYAMSIHKSQGSEFNHVILPMSMEYVRMLYNKLLYTGVSFEFRYFLLSSTLRALPPNPTIFPLRSKNGNMARKTKKS